MSPSVQPIPEGYPRVIPSLAVDGAAKAIDFYCDVFGATERMRMGGPDGKIGHAELTLGDSLIFLADEFPDMGFVGPAQIGGTPVTVSVYVDDVDAAFDRAVKGGAKVLRRSRTSSTETGPASSRTPSGTAGASRRTSRTSRPTRWQSGPPRRWAVSKRRTGQAAGARSLTRPSGCEASVPGR